MRRRRGGNPAVLAFGRYAPRCVQLKPGATELVVVTTTEAAVGRAAAWAAPPPVAMPAIRVSRPAAVAILVVQRMRIPSPSAPPPARPCLPALFPRRRKPVYNGMVSAKHQKTGSGAPCAAWIGRADQ